MSETINDITREMREDWAMVYFSEGTKKKDGEYSNVAAIGSQTVASRIEVANKREMAHYESLLQKAGATVVELMNKMNAQHEENAELRALVKKMLSHIEELYQCQSPCDGRCLRQKESCEFRARRELIAKAKEVVK